MTKSHTILVRGILFLLTLWLGAGVILAEEIPTLRIGFPNENGSRKSFGQDFTAKLQEALPDFRVSYIDKPFTLEEGRQMIAEGTLDILGMAYIQEGDSQEFCFCKIPIGYTPTQVLCSPADGEKYLHSHTRWNGTTVACRENSYEQEVFATYAQRNNISYHEKLYPTDEAVHSALLSKEVNLAILNNSIARHQDTDTNRCLVVEELESRPWYLMALKTHQDTMLAIENALATLHEKDPAWENMLVKKHFIGRQVNALVLRSGIPGVDQYCQKILLHLEKYNSWRLNITEIETDTLPENLEDYELVCGIPNDAETRELLDFPPFPLGERALYLLEKSNSSLFSAETSRKGYRKLRIAFPTTLPERTEYFQEFLKRGLGYELSYRGNTQETLDALEKGEISLAVTDKAFSKDKFHIVWQCGSVPFFIATPKSHDHCAYSLNESLEYFHFYEASFLRDLKERFLGEVPPQGKVVRAAIYREVGLAEVNADGTLSGYTLEYIRRIAKLAGWDLEELPTNYVNAQRYVAEGQADVLLCAIITPERQEVFDYSQFDIGPLYYGLMTNPTGDLKPNRPDTWQKARIAFLRGSKSVLDLTRFLNDRKVSWSPVPYDNLEKAEQAVQEGKIDAVYSLISRHSQDLTTLAVLPTELTYICTTKKKPELIGEVNRAMAEIHRFENDFQNKLTERFFPGNQDALMIDSNDLQVLEENHEKPINVDIYPLLAPLKEYDNDLGTAVGFIRDICNEISESTGLRFHFLPPVSEDESRKRLILGECDLWFGYGATTQASAHLPGIPDAIQAQAAIIRRQGTVTGPTLQEETVAIAENDIFLREHFENSSRKLLLCPTRRECYRAVANHEADFTIDSLQAAGLMLHPGKTSFPSLAFQPVDQQNFMLPFPIYLSPRTAPEIQQVLTKAFKAITAERMNDFLYKANFGRQQPILTGTQLGYILGLIIFLGLLIVVLIMAYFNSQLKRERDMALEARKAQRDADMKRMEHEAANKAKSSFLFNMSHDIRTPMNAITGYTAMAQKHIGDVAKVNDYLGKIEVSSKHLLELINGVLDMSRIESGKLTLSQEACNLNDIANGLLVICSGNAQKKGIKLIPQIDKLPHPVVITDTLRLNQVLLNILNNAIKYTPQNGTVTFKLNQHPCDTPEKVECVAVISDTGIGMSEEFQKRLFEPFSREKNTTVSGIEGTGLGLAIVKHILDIMGAGIRVQSQQGEGTTITIHFQFPIGKENDDTNASQSAILELSEEMLKGKRVLLVEDNEMNREIAREMLQGHRMVVEEADDGDVAVRKIQENAPGYYAFVLMDIQMPRMNGYEATRAIRKITKGSDFRLPIIAMTANAFAEDKKDALDAGMDAHLAKPIHENEVIAVLRKFA